VSRLLEFNPEPFEREVESGAALGGRDFENGPVAKPCGCRHTAAAGKLSAFEMDRELDGGQPSVPVAPSPTPRLLGRESTPPSATLYVEIDLKITDRARIAAIFIPEGHRRVTAVDLVLYLHGFKADAIKREAIVQYWNSRRFPYGAFREGVNASARNLVLVAATLGSRSEAGNLLKHGGLDAFLRQALAVLRAYGQQSSAGFAPALSNLIFSCHSGGGWDSGSPATASMAPTSGFISPTFTVASRRASAFFPK